MPKQKEPKRSIRIRNACDVYDVSRSTIYRAIYDGRITPVKVGGCTILSVSQLDKLFLGVQE
ncbi:MAG: helix-turn-helix domain-containing protein [Amylibacter sp.]|nr:helix-turn-helix domain-containing protein [Amylibacter sp.]